MGPHPSHFGPEPTWTEVEKQWEEAAPEPHPQGDTIAFGLLAVILIVIAVHTYKVFTN